ncbi:hypothetical protein [Asanoa iriomotensis]|nr:hypothetical protein [Asanoa iriomotensis]
MTATVVVSPGRVCGHRYQEATDALPPLSCGCGLFAVGTCRDCGEPKCGVHAVLGDRMSCTHCVAARRNGRREQAIQSYRDIVARLAATRDLIDRRIRCDQLLGHLAMIRSPATGGVADWVPEIRQATEQVRPSEPWDGAAAARWFLAQADARGIDPNATWYPVVERRSLFKSRHEVGPGQPAWLFDGCADLIFTGVPPTEPIPIQDPDADWRPAANPDGSVGLPDAWLLQDGQLLTRGGFHVHHGEINTAGISPPWPAETWILQQPTALHERARTMMGRLLGIKMEFPAVPKP